MLTLDSSGLYALLDRRDLHHRQARAALDADPGPFLMPMGILAEIGYLVEKRLGPRVLDIFLRDLVEGGFAVECGEEDLERAQQVMDRYKQLPLGVADALVIACAERNGGRVLSFDFRHFGVVAGDGLLELVGV
ncbi:MAG: PIN domain-containing protein [bacterium]|nr:PIN domain-containing protein [bacterium]